MELVLVAAVAANSAIGQDGELPWRLGDDIERFSHLRRADMGRFRRLTMGHPVIMGRKTYESIPERFRPLKNRRNVVLSRDPSYAAPGAFVYPLFSSAINSLVLDAHEGIDSSLVYVIGGQSVFAKSLPLASRLEITHVHEKFPDADVYFPEIDASIWARAFYEDVGENFSFAQYVRR